MFFQWIKSDIFIQNRTDIVCYLFYKIIIFAHNHSTVILCKNNDFILIYKRIICFLLDRTQFNPLRTFMISASLSVIFLLTQPAMPAKKDNEIPLYIKQNTNRIIITAWLYAQHTERHTSRHNHTLRAISTHMT